jgi:hypothetical protein
MYIIPATQEVEIRKRDIQGQSGQKVSETSSQQNKVGVVAHVCNFSYAGGSQSEADAASQNDNQSEK